MTDLANVIHSCSARFRFFAILVSFAFFVPTVHANADAAANYYEDGLVRFNGGDLPAAAVQLKNALKEDPSLLSAHILLARVYLGEGGGLAAETEIKEAIKRGADPSLTTPVLAKAYLLQFKDKQLLMELSMDGLTEPAREELLLTRGQAMLDLGQPRKAIQTFKQAEDLDPSGARPLVGQASAALRLDDIDAAAQAAEKAVSLEPDSAAVWNAQGAVYQARGDLKKAISFYDRALKLDPNLLDARVARVAAQISSGQDDKVGDDLKYLSEHNAADPRPAYLRAVKLAKAGDVQGARSALLEANSLLDQLNKDWVSNNSPLLLLAGTVNYGIGDFERARVDLQQCVDISPSNVSIRKLLGSTLLALHDPDEALTVLRPAREAAPDDPAVLTLLASVWMTKGQYSTAASLLQQAAAQPSAGANVRAQMAINQLFRGYPGQALNELSSVLKEDPADTRAGLLMAVMDLQSGNFSAGEAMTSKLLAKSPDNPALLNLLAAAQAGNGDRASARATLEKILKLDPQFLAADINLARIDVADGKLDDARKRLVAVLKSHPKSIEVYMELARTEEGAGKPNEAIRWLEQGRTVNDRTINLRLYLTRLLMRQKLYDRADKVIWEAQTRAPKNLEVLDLMAELQMVEGKIDLARTTLKQMTDIAAFEAPWLVKISARQEAIEAWSDARYSLTKAEQGNPDFQPARRAMIELAIAQGDLDLAGDQMAQFVQRWPNEAITEQLLGDLAIKRGNAKEAVAHYRNSFKMMASTAVVVRLAAALMVAGQGQDAVSSLSDWLSGHSNDVVARQALAKAYLGMGDKAAARAQYVKIVSQSPADAISMNNLAYLMSETGDKEALEYARRAHDLAPRDPHVNDTLGWILVRQNNPEEGLRYLRDAQSREAASGAIEYHIAVALVALGRDQEARDVLDSVLGGARTFSEMDSARALRAKLGK